MTESNITDKLAEAINNSFKKTKIFEKAEKIEKVSIFIGLFVSTISLFTLYNTYMLINIRNSIINNKIMLDDNCKNVHIKFNEYDNEENIFKYF